MDAYSVKMCVVADLTSIVSCCSLIEKLLDTKNKISKFRMKLVIKDY
jgi:hypothetical protein